MHTTDFVDIFSCLFYFNFPLFFLMDELNSSRMSQYVFLIASVYNDNSQSLFFTDKQNVILI